MKIKTLLLLLFLPAMGISQQTVVEFTYDEFLEIVKSNHPTMSGIDNNLDVAVQNLRAARGIFDPRIEGTIEEKQYNGQEYYSLVSGSLKIPTWYGIELKGGFENNTGNYLNPQNVTPSAGLTALGISVPIGRGLLINERLTILQKARRQIDVSASEMRIDKAELLFTASLAYYNWKRSHEEMQLYQQYKTNAEIRLAAVRSLILNGDKPAIDSIEAGIAFKTRILNLEQSTLKLLKARLNLSNFLWTKERAPLELSENAIPQQRILPNIERFIANDLASLMEQHPKITALERKIEIGKIERRFKANSLLPIIRIDYTHLSEAQSAIPGEFSNYKIGALLQMPLFLRKERAELRIAKLRLDNSQIDLEVVRLELSNKLEMQQKELESLTRQIAVISELAQNHKQMVASEERLFSFGESSLFIINSRENNYIGSKLAEIEMQYKLMEAEAEWRRLIVDF